MLGKVFKYEFKAAGRFLLPISLVSLPTMGVLFLLRFLALSLQKSPMESTSFVVGTMGEVLLTGLSPLFLSTISMLFTGVLAVRFYQSFNGAEGYTTFALPVSVSTHLWGRVLTGVVYSAIGSTLILPTTYLMLPQMFWQDLHSINPPPGMVALCIAGFWLMMFLGLLTGFMQLWLCIGIGSQFTTGRIGICIAAYFIISTVEGFLSALLTLLPFLPFLLRIKNGEMPFMALNGMTDVEMSWYFLQGIFVVCGVMMLIYLLFSAVHFLLCRWLYTKRLNLV